MTPDGKRLIRRRVFAALAVLSAVVLIAFELLKPPAGTTRGERWFWLFVGVLAIGMGVAELLRRSDPRD